MTKLTIELVPSTCWYSNVRTRVTKAEWDLIRGAVYQAANNTCEICGGKGTKWPVEAHEIWVFEDATKTQKLERIIALCPDCHLVKHIGRAQATGQYQKALSHLCVVNSWIKEDAEAYIQVCYEVWSRRSSSQWQLDISLVDSYLKEW